MNEQLELTLLEALDLQEQGLSLDEILARYPAEAAQLRPYLTTAFQLARLATQPDLATAQQARRVFLTSADRQGGAAQPARRRAWWGPARALAALAFLFLVAAWLLATASTAALPGDALYTTKQIVEGARLVVVVDPQANAALRERFRRERLDEVRAMLSAGREGRVSVEGRIEAMDGTLWVVDGLEVAVAPETPVDGSAEVGALARIDGRVEAGAFLAERVVVLESLPVLPTPTPRPPAAETATPQPPATPSESAPATPRPTTGPASTLTATPPSPTLAAPAPTTAPVSPTAPAPTTIPAPQPSPTPTAVVDDDNNDNDDGNPNGNANDNDDNDNDDDPNGNGNDNANDNDDPNGNGNANANDNGDNDNDDNDNDDDPNGNDDDEGNGNDDNDNNDNNDNDNGDNDNQDSD